MCARAYLFSSLIQAKEKFGDATKCTFKTSGPKKMPDHLSAPRIKLLPGREKEKENDRERERERISSARRVAISFPPIFDNV